jgi:hypothetical protein
MGLKQALLRQMGLEGPGDLTITGKSHFGFQILWDQTDHMDSFSFVVGQNEPLT